MTVRELIEKLSELNQDLPVLTQGYEGGFTDIKGPYFSFEQFGKVGYKLRRFGEYEQKGLLDKKERSGDLFQAIVLGRTEYP